MTSKEEWQRLQAEAEADVVKFTGDLQRVDALLASNPQNQHLIDRRKMIKQHVDSLQKGIDVMKTLQNDF